MKDKQVQLRINDPVSDILSPYDMAHLIGVRANHIEHGAMPTIKLTSEMNDPIQIAQQEMAERKFPLCIKINLGGGQFVIKNPNEMIIL